MLLEAARWVDALGVVMWEEGELDRPRIDREMAAQQFVVAEAGGEVAGVIRFPLEAARPIWPHFRQISFHDRTLACTDHDEPRLPAESGSRRSP